MMGGVTVTRYNFTEKCDVAYPAGHFDMSLNLIDGNPLMYQFFNTKVYSIYKLLGNSDKARVETLTKLCLENPGIPKEDCIHITNNDVTECYVLSMYKLCTENVYYAELMNVSDNKNTLNSLNERIMVARDCLTIMGEAIFSYAPNTNKFQMFMVNNSQNIEIFNMDFDEWVSLVLTKKLIEDEDVFEAFCYILKNATVSQSFKFHGRILTDQNVLENYKVSFTPHSYLSGNNKIVLGTWAIINESTENVEENAFEAAHIDGLTGLLNKKAIMKYAENAVNNAQKTGHQVSLAVMDIDNFKGVNDNYGHLFGDKVIKAVGSIIKECAGSDAVAGRMGGDEFLIVFEKYNDELEYRNVLRCIKTKVNYVYQNKFENDNYLTCSIGLARYGIGICSTNYHDLFKIADRALYLAKQKGKNRYIIYKPELHGDFNSPDDKGDIVNLNTNYYSDEDIDRLYELLSRTVIDGSDYINEFIDKFAQVLRFDRINIFLYGEEVPSFSVVSAAASDHGYSCFDVINDKQYMSSFVKNRNILSNIHGIEYTYPDMYKKYSEADVYSLMQYLLVDDSNNVVGFITCEVLGKFATFPKFAVSLFEIAAKTINSVLIRDGRIKKTSH
jgi:diguanylate cyclase (GGDEF)-like protein